MAGKRLIVVVGATGAQRGCVARALLEGGTFQVRAGTRRPMKKAARELKQKGAEVIKADQDDEPSLVLALADAYGALIVTNFWEHCSKEKENEQSCPWGTPPTDERVVEDIGPVVLTLLKSPEEYVGQAIGLSTGKLTKMEYAAVLSQQTDKMVEASKISLEEYEKCGFPESKELAAMFRFYALKPDCNVTLTMLLNTKACTFHRWLADNKAAF